MTTVRNTIGAVQWESMWAGTTGDGFVLVIPAFFRGNHVPFLRDLLTSKLAEIFDYDVNLGLDPGEQSQSDRGSAYEPGQISIGDIRQPWPNAAKLRSSIEDAFVQAGEVEAEQMRLADELVEHLRSA